MERGNKIFPLFQAYLDETGKHNQQISFWLFLVNPLRFLNALSRYTFGDVFDKLSIATIPTWAKIAFICNSIANYR